MNFLHIEKDVKKNTVLTVLTALFPITYIFKMWYESEMIFNVYGIDLGNFIGRFISYGANAFVGYLLAFGAIMWAYSVFSRSKYSPIDDANNCMVNKQTFIAICYFIFCIANIVAGLLNFVAYFMPISTVFITVLLPKIVNIFALIAIFWVLYLECKKEKFKELFTAIAIPFIIMLLLVR